MQRSLRRDLSVRIGLVIFCISIVIGAAYYSFSVRLSEKEFRNYIENQTKSVTDTFTLQLWLFDLNTTQELCKLLLNSPQISGLRLVDHNNEVIFEHQPSSENPSFRVSKELRYKGDKLVGAVDIFYANTSWLRQRKNILIIGVCTALGTILGSFLFINILLRRYLSKPLEDLREDMELFSQGGFHRSDLVGQKTEIQNIIDTFNAMAVRLAQRDAEILSKSEALELEIVERKGAEAAIEKAGLEWSTAMDASEDAIYLLDINRHVLRANKVFYQISHSTPETAMGVHIDKLVHPHGEISPCLVCRAQEELRDAVIIMEAESPDNPVGRPIEATVKIVKDDKGNPVSIFMRLHDLTEQRKVEDALRKSKDEWERTFDAIGDIITIQDREMRIVNANKAAYLAFPEKAGGLVGRYCYEIFRHGNQPCQDCPELLTIQDGKTHSANIYHEDMGKMFHVTTSAIPVESGEFTNIIHIAKDVTAHKKMEAELFQAHKMEAVGTLAGGIAHDFNNILAAVLGYADLAREEVAEGSQARSYIEQVFNAGNRAKDLVKQILAFSRKGMESPQPMEPSPVIKEALKLMRASLPTTIEIRDDINSFCGLILANPTNVHQVLVNLCTNALHAMEQEKGVLTVKLTRVALTEVDLAGVSEVSPGMFVELLVSDTGCGMDKETMERIFEPYFTTKEVGKGTGMGMAVVHGIVQSCGGVIKVESEPGVGSTFRVYFPVIEERAEQLAIGSQGPLPTGNERILAVDDEEVIVGMYKAVLEHLGYKVSANSSSEKTFEVFKASPYDFDLVITDQTMPSLTGAELARKILQIRPDMPIVLCTGYSSVISPDEVRTIGIERFVMKPVSRYDLACIVREVLDKQNQEVYQ